jgi:hypothetical protein
MDVGDEDAVAVLDFVIKTIIKVGVIVCYPPVRLTHALGRITIFIDDFSDKDQEATSAACMDLCHCYVFRLVFDLRFGTASRALWGTSRHPDLFSLPVDLRVVLVEPGEAEDHGLLAQRGDCELGLLCMALVAQDNICDFSDGTCFVGSAIDIVDRDGAVRRRVEMLFERTYSVLTNRSVALQSTSTFMLRFIAVSVVSISMSM